MNKKNIAVFVSKFFLMEKFWIISIVAISVFCSAQTLNAQVRNSIYSMFGVGQLNDNSYGINKALGGTGIAFQSGRSINNLNPASYLGSQSSYIVEAGVSGIYSKSENQHTSQTFGDVNLGYFSASLYFTNWWASSFGIVPFSSVNYEINSSEEIGGEIVSFDKTYEGSGGLSRIYWGNSFNVFDNLNAGFNASYIVGTITRTETAASNESFTGYELKNKRAAYSLYFDYGLQYSIGDDAHSAKEQNWVYTIGLIYGAGKKLHTNDDLEFTYNGATSSLEQEKQLDIRIPQKFGIGIAVKNGNNFRAGFDYEWAEWSNINFSNPNLDTKNSSRFSIGAEYFPGKSRDDSWLKKMYYRLGANYKNSYLEIDNTPINSKGITFGVGIPYDYTSTINFSIEYGEEGTLSKGLIKNSYWQFYLSFSLPELWSSRSKFD